MLHEKLTSSTLLFGILLLSLWETFSTSVPGYSSPMTLPSLRLLESSLRRNMSVIMWEKEMAVAGRRKLWNLPYKIIQALRMNPAAHGPLPLKRETKIAG